MLADVGPALLCSVCKTPLVASPVNTCPRPHSFRHAKVKADASAQVETITPRRACWCHCQRFNCNNRAETVPATSDLPAELLLEVASNFEVVVPFDRVTHRDYDAWFHIDEVALERQDALRAMSQVSQRWRKLFLPLLWENVEIAACRKGKGQWHEQCSMGLIKKGNGLAENPELAQYVQNIRVAISKASISEALAALSKALAACTNLKTVNMHYVHDNTAGAFKEAFKPEQTFPSIENLLIPTQAHSLLRACPNAKRVTRTRGFGDQFVTAILKAPCKKLEMVIGFGVYAWKDNPLEKLIKVSPGLQHIKDNLSAYEAKVAELEVPRAKGRADVEAKIVYK
ncbi:hypothetical protein DFP72DRAFT_945011 [Ephemerocybe angulata]|uniref:Uncharacterized protein n=1 Tax=Ephemerocybe angulata TaxID=980116 RepID=A0A8H6H6I1_9AGAR|nr:hypothetical protein DFP72DRAFT_945011 [Tulosesus angulatus]